MNHYEQSQKSVAERGVERAITQAKECQRRARHALWNGESNNLGRYCWWIKRRHEWLTSAKFWRKEVRRERAEKIARDWTLAGY